MPSRKITRKEWIEALKSGKYKQGTKVLCRQDGAMCCLGVAMELTGFDRSEDYYSEYDEIIPAYFYIVPTDFGNVKRFDFPHNSFINELALDQQVVWDGMPRCQANVLANLNDLGYTFEQIADLLIFDSWARGLE